MKKVVQGGTSKPVSNKPLTEDKSGSDPQKSKRPLKKAAKDSPPKTRPANPKPWQ
jgi:hypothetical protein